MAIATSTSARTAAHTGRSPGFGATLASEWTKLASLRTTWITLAIALLLPIALSALIGLAIGATWEDQSQEMRDTWDPILTGLAGTIVSAIVLPVLGVNAFAGEYSSGMVRLTFTITPRRVRVLLAKVLLVAALSLVVGLISTAGMFLAAQAVYGAYDVPTASLGDNDALRAVLLIGLLSPMFPVIGTCLAVLLRSTAGAITAVLAFIFAPGIFSAFLPRWWQENVIALLPGPASDSITIGHLDPDNPSYLEPAFATIAVSLWLVLFVGFAAFTLNRRDA